MSVGEKSLVQCMRILRTVLQNNAEELKLEDFTKAAERFFVLPLFTKLNELAYLIFVLPDVFCSRRLRPLLLLPQARCNEFFEEADLRGFRLRPCF